VYAQRGEVKKAVESFNIAIREDPTYHKAHHNLAIVLYALEEYEKSLLSVNRALELKPSDANAYLLKATVLRALGREAEARTIEDDVEFMPQGNWRETMDIK
jgi:tetratricopeptide (TPR) repeat protein